MHENEYREIARRLLDTLRRLRPYLKPSDPSGDLCQEWNRSDSYGTVDEVIEAAERLLDALNARGQARREQPKT